MKNVNEIDRSFNKDQVKELVEDVIRQLDDRIPQGEKTPISPNEIMLSKESKDPRNVAKYLIDNIYTQRVDTNNENYFCFMQNDISPYSIVGDMINSFYNPYAASVDLSQGTAKIENSLLTFFASTVGYDSQFGGQFVSGASLGNLSALIVARDDKLEEIDYERGVVYLSDQAHSSLVKAAKIIGVKKSNIRIVPSCEDYKIDTKVLEAMVVNDIKDGRLPFCLVGTLGTTNTGVIDPLDTLADIAHKYNMWFHVDAAYGGSVLLSSYRHLASGMERSDSMTWDAHKWLFQTYGCSMMLCRDRNKLLQSFSTKPEYLRDVESDHEKINFWDLGIEMTRPARGMKLWYTLQVMGLEKVRQAIDRVFVFGDQLSEILNDKPFIQVVSAASLGIINFRYFNDQLSDDELNHLNKYISDQALMENETLFMTTTLNGMTTLRFNFKNPRTEIATFELIIDKINRWSKEYLLANNIVENNIGKVS